jgi:hypothetical protein
MKLHCKGLRDLHYFLYIIRTLKWNRMVYVEQRAHMGGINIHIYDTIIIMCWEQEEKLKIFVLFLISSYVFPPS